MDRRYVSEFEIFMKRYLEDHPEVVDEQRRYWSFCWSPAADLRAPAKAKKDPVPKDH